MFGSLSQRVPACRPGNNLQLCGRQGL